MATSGEVVEFGWEDADSNKPISGRRKKAIKEQKKKNKSGTFGKAVCCPSSAVPRQLGEGRPCINSSSCSVGTYSATESDTQSPLCISFPVMKAYMLASCCALLHGRLGMLLHTSSVVFGTANQSSSRSATADSSTKLMAFDV